MMVKKTPRLCRPQNFVAYIINVNRKQNWSQRASLHLLTPFAFFQLNKLNTILAVKLLYAIQLIVEYLTINRLKAVARSINNINTLPPLFLGSEPLC